MSKNLENGASVAPCNVFIVTVYQNIIGVYANAEDAFQVQREYIAKNRPADVLCRAVLS